jgi:hypothetical protein
MTAHWSHRCRRRSHAAAPQQLAPSPRSSILVILCRRPMMAMRRLTAHVPRARRACRRANLALRRRPATAHPVRMTWMRRRYSQHGLALHALPLVAVPRGLHPLRRNTVCARAVLASGGTCAEGAGVARPCVVPAGAAGGGAITEQPPRQAHVIGSQWVQTPRHGDPIPVTTGGVVGPPPQPLVEPPLGG